MIYENKHYYVEISKDVDEYLVVNKTTTVTEYKTSMQPEAIRFADILSGALDEIFNTVDKPTGVVTSNNISLN